ncbi:MAG: twin-arginine translocase subunit TatC [Dehalococcoidales bacterium]|nr:twin-arginine translocase subunit TatC [Dehalococcoidales bacterium]
MSEGEQKLTLLGHFQELRKRLIRSVIAVAVAAAISFVFWKWIFYILIRPAGDINLIFIELTEMIGTIMRVCLAGGLIIAMPYLTVQAILFIKPALTRKEERYIYFLLPWIALMFLGGIVFGYFILIPPAIGFLYTFGSDIAEPMIKIGNYIAIITRLLIAIGLVFELPVVTTFLARMGIVKPEWLASKRKMAIIVAFVLAAIITPTFDPINQSLVAVPLIILYEMSIWLAKLVYRKRTPAVEATPEGLDTVK